MTSRFDAVHNSPANRALQAARQEFSDAVEAEDQRIAAQPPLREMMEDLTNQARYAAQVAVKLEAAKKSEFWEVYRESALTSDQATDAYKAVDEAHADALAKCRIYVALHQALAQIIQYTESREAYKEFSDSFRWDLNI